MRQEILPTLSPFSLTPSPSFPIFCLPQACSFTYLLSHSLVQSLHLEEERTWLLRKAMELKMHAFILGIHVPIGEKALSFSDCTILSIPSNETDSTSSANLVHSDCPMVKRIL